MTWLSHTHPWIVLVLFGGGLVAFMLLVHRVNGSGGPGRNGSRMARRGELRALGRTTGIALGYLRGRLLRAPPNASVMLIGATQSGKTRSALVRAILDWGDRPLFVLSVKNELLGLTQAARAQVGDVKVFDPTGFLIATSNVWSPVAAVGERGPDRAWSEARKISAGLLQIGQEAAERDREPHWRESAAAYLAPLLMAAEHAGFPMSKVLSWVKLAEKDDVKDILQEMDAKRVPHAAIALEDLEHVWRADSKYAGSVLGTLKTALDPWQEPRVAEATASSDITASWLCNAANTLYIVAPGGDQRRLQSLFGCLLTHILDGAQEIAQLAPAGRLDRELLCVLDEVCNTAPIPTLSQVVTTCAGQGILMMSVIQDYAQAVETWGDARAATIVGNHAARVVWAGSEDPRTTKYVEDVLGQQEFQRRSRTRGRGGASTTEGVELRPLVSVDKFRMAAFGTALLIMRGYRAVWLREPEAASDRRFRARVGRLEAVDPVRVRDGDTSEFPALVESTRRWLRGRS